jgi:hypothetical protein
MGTWEHGEDKIFYTRDTDILQLLKYMTFKDSLSLPVPMRFLNRIKVIKKYMLSELA